MILFAEPFWPLIFGLYLLATLLQLLAWWGVFGKLAFGFSKTPIAPIIQYPPISVVICARNEAPNLRQNLPEVLSQQYHGSWELWVVDDASTDETPAVLNAFQEQFPERLNVLRIPDKFVPGKKQALTQGITSANFDQILLTDSDCTPNSIFWLAQMSKALNAQAETEIVLGYAPLHRARWKFGANWPRYEAAWIAAQYGAFALSGHPYMGVGRNLAFKRQVFDRVGGFAAHAHLISGDDDLLVNAAANARNTVLCMDSDAFMFSDPPPSFKAWMVQKRRHLSASPAYRRPHQLALGLLALSQVGHYAIGFCLLLGGYFTTVVLWAFLLRQVSVFLILSGILRRFKAKDLITWIPMLDACMAIQYATLVPYLLWFKKDLKWN